MFQTIVVGLLALCVLSSQALLFTRTQPGGLHVQDRKTPRQRRSVFPGPVTPDSCSDPPTTQLSQEARNNLNDVLSALDSDQSDDIAQGVVKYAKNLVLNRALFLSIALQLQNETAQFPGQPGFLYYYVSAVTALTTAPQPVVGSGTFFDTNKHYPNWYRGVYFNSTIPLFAPRALRQQMSELRVDDYGANVTSDYTSPDQSNTISRTEVHTVQRRDRFGDVTEVSFYAAPHNVTPEVTGPYYDCARGDRWLMTFTSPVVDKLPRYTAYRFLMKPRYVAVATADLDVDQLVSDITPEITGFHNMLVPMLDCPNETPSPGSGSLSPTTFRSKYPQARLALRLAHSLSAFLQNQEAINTSIWEEKAQQFMEVFAQAVAHVQSPQDSFRRDENNIGGAWIDHGPQESPSSKIKLDGPLTDTMLEAEVLTSVLTDPAIRASGVFFHTPSRVTPAEPGETTPSPKAFMAWRSAGDIVVGDLSASTNPNQFMMSRSYVEWRNANSDPDLTTYTYHAGIRSSRAGAGLTDFAVDPLQYRASRFGEGYQWSSPYYKCDGYVDDWVISFAAPFFGPSHSDHSTLVFKGIVTVDVAATADDWSV